MSGKGDKGEYDSFFHRGRSDRYRCGVAGCPIPCRAWVVVPVIDPQPSLPEGGKARRVYLSLKDDIANGLHGVGSHLPAEQKLAATYDVSRVTVRRALDALCTDGLIERHAGSGTVVCRRLDPQPSVRLDFTTLMPQLAEMGRNTTARLLSFGYGTAPEPVAVAMGLPADASVQIATRVRCADEQPFSHLITYVPESIARNYTEKDLAATPLFELLERSGVAIDGAHQSVSATLASPEVAKVLDVAVGSALLSLQRVVRDSKGHAVEYLWARYRPDLFRIDMELARIRDGATHHWQPVVVPHDTRQAGKRRSRDSKSGTPAGGQKNA